jgi:Uma2 family endonuclease
MAPTRWTVAKVQELTPPDYVGWPRYEVVDGELLVSPGASWQHQRAVFELAFRLGDYLRAHPVGLALFAPVDIIYDDETLVQPDVFVAPLKDGRKPRSWEEAGSLLLAIEVLSPSTARADRQVKRKLYQREDVPEYWIVDADAEIIERWRPGEERPEVLADRIAWQPDPAHPPLVIDLPEFFATVRGE